MTNWTAPVWLTGEMGCGMTPRIKYLEDYKHECSYPKPNWDRYNKYLRLKAQGRKIKMKNCFLPAYPSEEQIEAMRNAQPDPKAREIEQALFQIFTQRTEDLVGMPGGR